METLIADRTVGEIAAETPASVRVFERHGIDFCCGGKIPVAEACRKHGLDAAALLAEIAEASKDPAADTTDWTKAPLVALADHILETHHVYTKTQLPRIDALLQKVLKAHSERHGETLAAVANAFAALKADLEGHLMKEEMILFPLIKRMSEGGEREFHCGSVRNPIRVMIMEHDSAGESLEDIRRTTNGYAPPEDACNTFRALYFELSELERDLHRHIHLENNILFPRVIAIE